jgi:signal recognition particle subunit SRP54
VFDSLSSKFSGVISTLRGKGKIRSSDLEEILGDMRTALLDSDVALEVVNSFLGKIESRVSSDFEEINRSTNPAQAVFNVINEELVAILGGSARRINLAKKPPTVIMLTGLQGAGKTTLAGKLALYLKKQGNTPLLVASDLQRPNAVTQLQVVGESVGVPVFAPEPGNGVGDAVNVARQGISFATQKLHNIVIVDTAGRLGIDEELMNEAKRIGEAINPDELLYVVDAMAGQDALRTALAFKEGVGFDGVVMTKLDGDARGGAALSIVEVTGAPLLFISTGEKVEDFDLFYPDRMASRILGMGDVATLAEQAQTVIDKESAAKLEEKFIKGEDFTFDDFLSQLEAMQKMGSFTKLLGMLPGANAGQMKKQIDSLDDRELIRTQAIIQSMTPLERNNPKILNGSRRARIAKGSGRSVSEINNLVDRFSRVQKMMKQFSGMSKGKKGFGLPGMGMAGMGGVGLPGMGGLGMGMPSLPSGGNKGSQPPKKKSKSGNPAKRAAENGQ